jgi:hypothetical protein
LRNNLTKLLRTPKDFNWSLEESEGVLWDPSLAWHEGVCKEFLFTPHQFHFKVLAGSLKVLAGSLKVLAGSLKVLVGSLKVLTGSFKVLTGSFRVLVDSLGLLRSPKESMRMCGGV